MGRAKRPLVAGGLVLIGGLGSRAPSAPRKRQPCQGLVGGRGVRHGCNGGPCAVLSPDRRRQIRKRGHLAAAERAELGHLGAQVGSRETTAARGRLDDVGAARENGIGGNAAQHALLAGGNAGLEGVECHGGRQGGLRIEFSARSRRGCRRVARNAAPSVPVLP